jgi:hypothetical protein
MEQVHILYVVAAVVLVAVGLWVALVLARAPKLEAEAAAAPGIPAPRRGSRSASSGGPESGSAA